MMKQDYVFYLKLLIKTFEQRAVADFSAQGLTLTQAKMLAFLNEKPGKSATQKEMEIFFNVSHPTITGVVQRLEIRGLVISEQPKKGRESKQVMLSDKGIETCRENDKSACIYCRAMMQGITKEEESELADILKKMYENICNGGGGTEIRAALEPIHGKQSLQESAIYPPS